MLAKKSVFSCFLNLAKDSAVRIEIERSFHQLGTVQEKIRESDLLSFCDGTTRRRSLQNVDCQGHGNSLKLYLNRT